jgi:S-formylglutathione hydrolase
MHGTWQQWNIGSHAADVYTPAGVARPAMAILFLHGIGLETLRNYGAFTTVFDELKLGCISPFGGESWWADRICVDFDSQVAAERYLLSCVVPQFERLWGVTPPRIGLLGISMGGQGALRLAFKLPRLFPAVAAISSAIEYHELYGQGTPLDAMYDSKEQCRQDTVPMHIQAADYPPHIFYCIDPTDWPWYRGNDRLHEKLAALGIVHQCDLTTQAGGHSWEYFNHMAGRAIRFLHDGMTVQSRRLL